MQGEFYLVIGDEHIDYCTMSYAEACQEAAVYAIDGYTVSIEEVE